jgi:N-acetylglutamate synthase-like GNAT family acetyltransferase
MHFDAPTTGSSAPDRDVGSLLLRPADSREVSRLQEIDKAARSRYRSAGSLSFAAETPAISSSRLVEGDVIVAEKDGRTVGFVLMNAMDGMLYIANISVDPPFAGRGIGAALIEAAEHHARSRGLTALALATFRTPRWNRPWFRQLGFQPMPADQIGPSLRAVLTRHRQFLDMRTRITMWRPICTERASG